MPHSQNHPPASFETALFRAFHAGRKLNITGLRKLAAEAGIATANEKYLWELTELAWTKWYRQLIQAQTSPEDAFDAVLSFYQKVQPTYTGIDSHKKVFQQYSTSAPIAFLAGWFTDFGDVNSLLEPSAGNGLLTIYYPERMAVVNDLDPIRLEHLQSQPFRKVLHRDASQPFPAEFQQAFDVVLSNPPFGSLGEVNRDYGFPFKALDHVMVAHALACLKSSGRAALLIGGHTLFNEHRLIASHRQFFNWLYRYYRVAGMFNIDAAKLYHKQGTDFPLRLILVAGRKAEPFGAAPSRYLQPDLDRVVDRFDDLFDLVKAARVVAAQTEFPLSSILELEIRKIKIEIT